jgi:jmjN domain/ARID/BRIGHT DNA binding domain
MPEEMQERGLRVPQAPVYRPSEEEFVNPLEYIAKIRPEAERYGICKIVPPASWKPPFMIDSETFEFNTRIQVVSELQNKVSSSPEYRAWNAKYLQFLKTLGKSKKRNPTFSGRDIELFKLHNIVAKRGGYQAVCDQKGWRDVARLLGVRAFRAVSWLSNRRFYLHNGLSSAPGSQAGHAQGQHGGNQMDIVAFGSGCPASGRAAC